MVETCTPIPMKKCEKQKHQRPRQVCVKAPTTRVVGGLKCNPLDYNLDSLSTVQATNAAQFNNFGSGGAGSHNFNLDSLSTAQTTNAQFNNFGSGVTGSHNYAVGHEDPSHDEQYFEASLYTDYSSDSSSSEEL